ncbi:MAG: transporter [Gemmatimonadetes bacterium]|nr:transporter [Gemmatimonadota bacterium]
MTDDSDKFDRMKRPGSDLPIGLLSFTAGAVVANLYYNQPLLPQIGRTFALPDSRVGLVNTTAQVGYAVGLLLFVPLGDVIERRRLMVMLLIAVSVSLAVAAGAPNITVLTVASFAIGVTTVVPQVVVPYAAGLVDASMRGRVVGRVMGGLLIGILAARVLAGAVGAVAGWRAMFAIAAVLMVALAIALSRMLPAEPPRVAMRYGMLLRSLVTIARTQPVVRDAGVIGALNFVAFSAFWTTLAFRLELPPLHYGSAIAGAFGLIGIVGASVAPMVGKLADKRTPRSTVGVGLGVVLLSFVLFALAGSTIAGLVIGVIVLDAGMQVVNISNQTRIYQLPAAEHNRLNTVYMVTYFAGGSLGSALGVWAWGRWQWTGVCAVGLGALALSAAVYLRGARRFSARAGTAVTG